jgi:1,4-dihydroxy-2-naphthoate octaprenyltransferase
MPETKPLSPVVPPWRIWLEATRPRTLPAAVAPVLVGSALAHRVSSFEPAAAGLCLLFALLVQIGANFANDYYDYIKGADTAARVGPRRAVAAGLVAPQTMRRAMSGVLAAAFVIGLGLLRYGGPWLLVIGLASIAAAVAYTGGPVPLGYLGLGDLMVFVFFGLVGVDATFFVQSGRLTAEEIFAAAPIGLLAANILLVNNYRDAETDAAAGKATLVVRFGRGFARFQFAASWAIALIVPVVFALRGRGLGCLWPLAISPVAWNQARRLRDARQPGELIRLLGDAGKALAAYSVLWAAGLW